MQQNITAPLPPPPRAGLSQSTTAPWTLERDIAAYASAGWSAIGVWLNKLERETMQEFWFPEAHVEETRVEAAATCLRSHGLPVSHVAVVGRFTESSPSVRQQRIDHAVMTVEIARRLGARSVIVVPGRLNGLTATRAVDMTAASLEAVLTRTAESGVRLAIEPVQEVDFVTTLDEAIDLAELLGDARLGVYPDSFHVYRDPGLDEAISRAGERIFGVHLADTRENGDGTRLPPGEGVIPLAGFVEAIERTGYAGTYDVELFTMGVTDGTAAATLERCAAGLRDLLPDR